MDHILTQEEQSEVNDIVEKADIHYRNSHISNETRQDWYAGVTADGEDDEFGLKRIRTHLNTDFPNLDKKSIRFWKVSSEKVAAQVEIELEKIGFDTGDAHQPPDGETGNYVYIFRKEKS